MNFTEAKNLKDFPLHDQNPFSKNLRIPVVPKGNMFVSWDKATVNALTGQSEDELVITGRRNYIDREDLIEIYTKELGLLFDLSKATQKLLSYLLLNKIGHGDTLIFNISQWEKELGYSRPTIFKSLKELLNKEFIARHIGISYWINPKLFYKGDRIVIVREYIKARKESTISKNQTNLFGQTNQPSDKMKKIAEKENINQLEALDPESN